MADNSLIQARKRAEQAVRDMEEGPLKIAAFQTILTKLLTDRGASERAVVPIAKPKACSWSLRPVKCFSNSRIRRPGPAAAEASSPSDSERRRKKIML